MTHPTSHFAGRLVAGLALAAAFALPASAQDAATVGSGGSAAVGGTSATTLGTAGASTSQDGDYGASLATGGSAAAADGKARSKTKIVDNPAQLKGQSKAMANDKGTFSKSKTKTRVKDGELSSRTKTMSHEPGSKPVIERSSSEASLPGE